MVAPDFLDSTILHAIGLTIASLEVLAAVHEDRADRSKVADACEFQQELFSCLSKDRAVRTFEVATYEYLKCERLLR